MPILQLSTNHHQSQLVTTHRNVQPTEVML